jgi:hypothetical protein
MPTPIPLILILSFFAFSKTVQVRPQALLKNGLNYPLELPRWNQPEHFDRQKE